MAGVPIGVALGLGGLIAIGIANADAQWFGLLAVPQNFYAGIAKYPLLALPMFVLVGSIFDRSGVARGLVNYSSSEARRIAGHGSAEIEALLGYLDNEELIHRDNLVLL